MVFICLQRWQTQGHVAVNLMHALWSALTLAAQVFDMNSCPFFVITDSALEDFVLMHCVFIPNNQLCPVLMAQYPFSMICYLIRLNVSSHHSKTENCVKKGLPYPALPWLFWSLTAVHLPRSGLTRLRPGEAGLHTEQQAQGDPPGDAVGRCAWRLPARGGGCGSLPRGQSIVTI